MEPKVDVSGDLVTVLEIVFLFLKNQNFFDTSEVFRNECEQLGITLPKKSGKVFFRTNEKISIIKNAKFIDKTIVLETLLQKDTEIENSSGEDISNKYVTEIEGKQHLKKQFSQLREEYKNLLTVTAELTKALQVHIVGQTKNINSVLDQCKVIYPSLFEQQENASEEETTRSHRNNEQIVLNEGFSHTETRSFKEVVTADELDEQNATEEVVGSDLKQENITSRSDCTDKILPTIFRNSAMKQRKTSEKNEVSLSNSGLNLDSNEEPKKNPSTPVFQHFKIPESDLDRVPHLPVVTDEVIEPNCCPNKTCKDCTNQISRILEEILSKVMVSPKCGASPHRSNLSSCRNDTNFNVDTEKAYCNHCETKKENSELQIANDDQPPGDEIMAPTTSQSEDMATQGTFQKKYHPKPVRFMTFQTPLCYVEACQKEQDVINNCKCAKCVPGKNRYYCGCYDLICKEIAAEMESMNSGSTCYDKIFENLNKNAAGEENPNTGGNCSSLCRNKSCRGAFVSKPRIRRTPPR